MDATALKLRAVGSSSAPASDAFLEARFRKTFEAAAIGIGLCDLEGRIVEANFALARLLGYERAELVGIRPWKDLRRCGEGESDRPESERAKLADAGPSYAREIAELLGREGEPLLLEKKCQRRDGSEFWARITASKAPDNRGNPAFLVLLLEDASDRRRTEGQLRQLEKMATIGQLTSGVAHDFNNLLTGILLYCDLLIPELEPGKPPHRYADEIRLATEQGAALTQQLLTLVRKEGLEPHAIDVNQITGRMENLLQRLIGEQIELITELDASAGTVVADAAHLQQILLNLVLNARDALGPRRVVGGKIQVSTRLAKWPGEARVAKGLPPVHSAKRNPAQEELGRNSLDRLPLAVLLTVEDNGSGMSAETCSHLFEPFFTTKAAGSGTGIGLGTVQRIVSELGGVVEITSAPASGTRVHVYLPAAGDQKGQASPESPFAQPCRSRL
jgi:two-component system, cell cycle sensor histidine kinase and response regulator CckA